MPGPEFGQALEIIPGLTNQDSIEAPPIDPGIGPVHALGKHRLPLECIDQQSILGQDVADIPVDLRRIDPAMVVDKRDRHRLHADGDDCGHGSRGAPKRRLAAHLQGEPARRPWLPDFERFFKGCGSRRTALDIRSHLFASGMIAKVRDTIGRADCWVNRTE